MRIRSLIVATATTATAFIALVGCSSSAGSEAGASGSPSQSSALTPVSVVTASAVPSLDNLYLYIAQDEGFFKGQGLNVTIDNATDGILAYQLTASGKYDIAPDGFEVGIPGYAQGLKGQFFFETGNNLSYYLAVPASSSITSLKQLEGQTIGVNGTLGSDDNLASEIDFQDAGLSYSTVKYVPFPSGSAQVAALDLQDNRVQAIMGYTGLYAAMTLAGQKLRYLKDPKLAGFGDLGLFSSQHYIATHPGVLEKFSRAVAEAMVWEKTNPAADAEIYWKISPASKSAGLAATVEQIKFVLAFLDLKAPYGNIPQSTLQTYITKYSRLDKTSNPPSATQMTTNRFISYANSFDTQKIVDMAKSYPVPSS